MGQTEEIALFPLSTVVLFPRIQCPLHLFEPRYRQLAAHVLEGDRRIGMVVVRPEATADMAGDPPVFEVGCAGEITEHQKLPDGRYNIALQGLHRFRILRELDRPPEQLFRVAEVEALLDTSDPSESERVSGLRPRVLKLARTLVERLDAERAESFRSDAFRGIDDEVFVNALSNAFPFAPAEKQGLLEEDSILRRLERLASVLRFHVAETRAPQPSEPGTLH